MFNRLANCSNKYQGKYKRVLCVCSAGMLRSPTAALVLSDEPYNYNTRAAGVSEEYALIPVDEVLIEWADEIVCMEQEHLNQLKRFSNTHGKKIKVLGIPDSFAFRDPALMGLIRKHYDDCSIMEKALEGEKGQDIRDSSGRLAE